MTAPVLSRRRLVAAALGAAAASLLPRPLEAALEVLARDAPGDPRSRALSFRNTHTGERLDATYWAEGRYLETGLRAIDWVLRDHRTNDVAPIDPGLLDLLHLLRRETGAVSGFEVISGYRSPHSNEVLRKRSDGVASRSLHLKGRAVDVRLPGVGLADLRDAAREARRGGVGFYPLDGFVHVDTGRVRSW